MVVIALTSHNLHLDSPRRQAQLPTPSSSTDSTTGRLLKPSLPTRRSSRIGLLQRETDHEEVAEQGYDRELALLRTMDRKGKGREMDVKPPTPVSPPPVLEEKDEPRTESPTPLPTTTQSPTRPMEIPPPPTPRRHRSGVLLSRVRAQSGPRQVGSSLSMSASKSWGDLVGDWAAMTTSGVSEPTSKRTGKARMASESSAWIVRSAGSRSPESTGWDNR